MPGVLFLNILDVGRALGATPREATPQSVADWLASEYIAKRGGTFTYDPAITSLFDLFKGLSTPEEAKKWCESHGNPKGRRQNAEAIAEAGPYAAANVSVCHKIGLTAVAVGRAKGETVYAGIKAPLLRIQENKAYIVMPGFRMSHRPSDAQIDFACSFALATFGRDDYEVADFEYIYAGPSAHGKGRMLQVVHGRDRDVYDMDTLDALLDIYVRGVSIALERGAPAARPGLRGYRIIDPDAPYFL
jgi:hypothetical protein